ncbi:hypothetical protein WJX84_004487 [Apatococcus fuscideae]|uniref:Uncharacterized protein n=1 Tax=Apatococcus fuscideae TaxID=2026836 RepID=A0AAW1T953_9CHLO
MLLPAKSQQEAASILIDLCLPQQEHRTVSGAGKQDQIHSGQWPSSPIYHHYSDQAPYVAGSCTHQDLRKHLVSIGWARAWIDGITEAQIKRPLRHIH